MVFLRPATAHLPFDHPFNRPFHPKCHIHMDQDGVDQDDTRSRVDQQAVANNLHREVLRKVRTPDNHPGHQQHENHAHDRPEHHLLPGVVLTDIRHFMLIAFQYFDNVQQPRNIFLIRDVVMHKTHKHKHQCDENRNAEKRVQNASHLRRTEGLRQPLQRREEERNPGQRHQEEANHHGPVTGAINKFGAHNHFRLTHDDPPRHRPLPYSGQYRCSGKSTRQKWQ